MYINEYMKLTLDTRLKSKLKCTAYNGSTLTNIDKNASLHDKKHIFRLQQRMKTIISSRSKFLVLLVLLNPCRSHFVVCIFVLFFCKIASIFLQWIYPCTYSPDDASSCLFLCEIFILSIIIHALFVFLPSFIVAALADV